MAMIRTWHHPTTKGGYDRVARDPRIVGGEDTLVFIVSGQSNASCWGEATAYAPTNGTKIDQINIEDGGCYALTEPHLGTDSGMVSSGAGFVGSVWGRFADSLIDNGICDRVIFAPCATGGAAISDFEPGGVGFERVLTADRRLKAIGLSANAILFAQGEANNGLGTSQAVYTASHTAAINGLVAKGVSAPWVLAKSTLLGGVSYAPVRASIDDDLVDNVTIFAGPDTDTLTGGTNRSADLTHFKAAGLTAAAVLWKDAWVATGL